MICFQHFILNALIPEEQSTKCQFFVIHIFPQTLPTWGMQCTLMRGFISLFLGFCLEYKNPIPYHNTPDLPTAQAHSACPQQDHPSPENTFFSVHVDRGGSKDLWSHGQALWVLEDYGYPVRGWNVCPRKHLHRCNEFCFMDAHSLCGGCL